MAAGKKKTSKKDRYPEYTSPIGTLQWPFLNRARDYKGDKKFKYGCVLVLSGQDAADLEKFIDQQIVESQQRHKTKKVASVPYDVALDDDGKEIEGATAFKFSVNATTETPKGVWDRKPAFYDAQGQPLSPPPAIGAGTEARLAYQVYHWKNPSGAGVTLQPLAVQVIRLVEYKAPQRSAKDMGFGNVEGGYVAPAQDDEDEGDEEQQDDNGGDF